MSATPLVPDFTSSRRGFLGAAGAAAVAGAAVVLTPMSFAAASTGSSRTQTITGSLQPGAADWVYLPVEVPRGVNKIAVSYSYSKPAVPSGTLANSCDIGIFDQHGLDVGGRGFRGWSGGSKTEFFISNSEATPGYIAGRVSAGTWNVILGAYQVSQAGMDYTVTVTLDFGEDAAAPVPTYPATKAIGRGRAWYRGDAHLHTVHSDGKRTPEQVAAGARAARLDFIVSTDHNTQASHGAWGPLAGDDLLIVVGEEVTTRNGHYLALGVTPGDWIDWRYRSGEREAVGFGYREATRQIHRDGGLVVPAHPYCPYVACRWKFGYAEADAVEIWNGPWTADDESAVETWDSMLAVNSGHGDHWLPAMGNSDAHSEPQVIGLPHNVVLADGLSREQILQGVRRGTSWIAESADVQLDFQVTGGGKTVGIGDRLAVARDAQVTVTVTVAGVPNGVIRFITDEGQTQQVQLSATGAGTSTWVTTPQLARYVRVEVRHPLATGAPGNGNGMGAQLQLGAMAALSNPIFLGR